MTKITVIVEYLIRPLHLHGVLHEFKVARVKNSLAPIAGGLMTKADIQEMIDQGVEVIIDPEGRKATARKGGGA
jgi:hypothetical protein